jgi:hypothetical protein
MKTKAGAGPGMVDFPWMEDWGRVLFFLHPRSSLRGKRPVDALREGAQKLLVELAKTEIE